MDNIASIGETSIAKIVFPTFGIYFPLQIARKDEIFKNPPVEHSYGSHTRQKLDVYLPPSATKEGEKLPCVVFVYGGGLVQGDKRIGPTQGAIYGNVGEYFSSRGFVTVLPDYRLYGTHDAQFPSGGEDVGLAIDWIVKNLPQVDKDKIFLIGNSAGCVATHLIFTTLLTISHVL
jgi:acetyl esterase/lipase